MKTFLLLNTKIDTTWVSSPAKHQHPFCISSLGECGKKKKSKNLAFDFYNSIHNLIGFLLRTEVVTLLTGLNLSITHSLGYIQRRTKLHIKIHTFQKSEYFHCEQTGELTMTGYSRSLFTLTKWHIDLHSLKTNSPIYFLTQTHCPESESESL